MPTKQYEDFGKLFRNERKDVNDPNDKKPLLQGYVNLNAEILDYLVTAAEAGQELRVEVAAWKFVSKAGKTFYSLIPQVPYAVKQGTNGVPHRIDRNASKRLQEHHAANEADDDIPF